MSDSERSRSRVSLSRRLFLRRALLTGASAAAVLPGLGLIAACSQPAAPAPPAAAPTTAPAAAPTTAPAAAPTQANPFAAKPTAAPRARRTRANPSPPKPPAAAAAPPAAAAAPTTAPAAASGAATRMTYWGGLIFSDAANNLFSQTVKDWGKQNNLDIDVVMIN